MGARLLIKITKIFFKGAGSLSDILQQESVKQIISKFFTGELLIDNSVLSDLPDEIKNKLKSLIGQSFDDVVTLRDALLNFLSPDEVDKYHLIICQKAAIVSTPDFTSILSISGHVIELIQGIVDKVDPDEFDGLISEMINHSVIRYRPEKADEFKHWINKNNDYAFDEFFAGRYHEMIELFVYLVLFNYGESVVMLKKNQILAYFQPFLDKIMKPKTAESSK